jgi:hypothetical protein
METITSRIYWVWDKDAPLPAMPPEYFSIEWQGYIEAPISGEYIFYLDSDNCSTLYINDKKLLDGCEHEISRKIFLEKGRHKIRVIYIEHTDNARIQLLWKLPGEKNKKVISRQYFHLKK